MTLSPLPQPRYWTGYVCHAASGQQLISRAVHRKTNRDVNAKLHKLSTPFDDSETGTSRKLPVATRACLTRCASESMRWDRSGSFLTVRSKLLTWCIILDDLSKIYTLPWVSPTRFLKPRTIGSFFPSDGQLWSILYC